MITLYYPEIPKEQKLVATTGFFDGVHLGHQQILKTIAAEAKRQNKKSCLITFWPHPRVVLGQDAESLRMLTPIEEKISLVAKLGIDYFYLIPFTQNFALSTSTQFFEDVLINKVNISQLYVGYNHRFGHNAQAGFDEIKSLGEKNNIEVFKIEAISNGNQKLSSTTIRQALESGDIATANEMLGYSYRISGRVVHGNQIGRTIGFPTANIQTDVYKLVPKNGVYAVRVVLNKKTYKGMLNIGLRPTFSNTEKPIIEVNIFDFDGDIYDETISVDFVYHVRNEVPFESKEKLKLQLQRDEIEIRHLLANE